MNYSQSESREMCCSDVDVQHPFNTIKSKGGGQGRHGQWKKSEEMNEIVKM